MKVDIYLDKNVAIELTNKFFYRGRVIDCDNDSLTITDITGKNVTIRTSEILSIREYGRC